MSLLNQETARSLLPFYTAMVRYKIANLASEREVVPEEILIDS